MKRCFQTAAIASLFLLLGCESKFNRKNFQMIQVGGDDREDVLHILGKPASKMDGVWIYDDPGNKTAAIYFDDDGRVVNKEWMDAGTGDWEGENPWTDRPPRGETRESRSKVRRIDDD